MSRIEEVWKQYIGMHISVCKPTETRKYFFNGTLEEVEGDTIILRDRKLGRTPLKMRDLEILDSKEE